MSARFSRFTDAPDLPYIDADRHRSDADADGVVAPPILPLARDPLASRLSFVDDPRELNKLFAEIRGELVQEFGPASSTKMMVIDSLAWTLTQVALVQSAINDTVRLRVPKQTSDDAMKAKNFEQIAQTLRKLTAACSAGAFTCTQAEVEMVLSRLSAQVDEAMQKLTRLEVREITFAKYLDDRDEREKALQRLGELRRRAPIKDVFADRGRARDALTGRRGLSAEQIAALLLVVHDAQKQLESDRKVAYQALQNFWSASASHQPDQERVEAEHRKLAMLHREVDALRKQLMEMPC